MEHNSALVPEHLIKKNIADPSPVFKDEFMDDGYGDGEDNEEKLIYQELA